MPQKNARNKSGRRAPYLFMALAMLLLLALIFLGVRALNAWNAYEKAAAITPTPSPTVRPVSVTTPPDFVTHTPAPSPTPSYLTNGSSGEMVTQLQQRLKELGFYTGQIDGQYGSGTKSAVTLFQQQHNLDADGVAGQKTLAVLYSDNAKQVVITPSPAPVDTLDGSVPLLVNKQNPVGKDFVPADLVRVKDLAGDLFTYADNDTQGVREAVEALIAMIRDAENQGYTPWKLREGYRTYAAQKRIFDNQVEKYIAEREMTRTQAVSATRQTVADPGCSEHHTGLAFDLNVPGEYFADTAQYLWLNAHCWDYGFIMRYTDDKKDITGITGEEWHVRYVGVDHSRKMQELGYCLEEYVDYLNGQN
ncbi:MAG: D-alanyl-D-alanine carboxypeptidase family protein [Eubacteriales bacterium]|nr:D-alanyl-D-alanine carboxypeptidase family protein [Eubacteriales bacterium]